MRYLFVGERPSPTALRRGWTWESGRLCAKQLFDSLRECGLDPARQRFVNLLDDAGVVNPAALRKVRRTRLPVVAMGKLVQRALSGRGVSYTAIPHPAARGKIRLKANYVAAVKEALMKFYEPTDILHEVASLIREWGVSGNPYGVRLMGGWFEYWEEINRTGQFKLKDGRVVVLDPPELRIALDLASGNQPQPGEQQ